MPFGWIFSRLIAIASPFRIMRFSMIRRERGLFDDPDHPPPRDLSAAVPSDGGEPDGLPRQRSRTDGLSRPSRLSLGMDRRASFGRVRHHHVSSDIDRDWLVTDYN